MVTWSVADYSFMSRALQLARRGLYTTHPNPRVGCVLVKENRVIAEGWHEFAGDAHAEINALNYAKESVAGASCYVSLEPCSHSGRTPPCIDALIEAGISKVIAAMSDPNPYVSGQGLSLLETAGIETASGLLESDARKINPGYIMRMTEKRPFVRCKLAMSLDGRTALANGESKWITGPEARMDVQRLRAQSSAVMTGIGTVLADDPGLDVRKIDLNGRHPLRVVVDPQLKFPASAKMLQLPGRTIIFTGNNDQAAVDALNQTGAEVVFIETGKEEFLKATLKHLAEVEEVNEVLLESGAKLAGSMLTNGLIDELILYQSPVLMGDGARGLFHIPLIQSMQEKIDLVLIDTRQIGTDMRFTLKMKSFK